MKYLFLLFIGFSWTFYAQTIDCNQQINEYQTLFQAKKFDLAYLSWLHAKSTCAPLQEAIYNDGIQILQSNIKITKLDSQKESLLRDALKLYDEFHKKFPLLTADFQSKKAMLIFNNSVRADQQIDEMYSLLEQAFTSAPYSVTDINAINLYFDLYCKKIKNKEIASTNATEKYVLLLNCISKLQENDSKNNKAYQQLTTNINSLAKKTLSVDNLVQYYQSNLNAYQSNKTWLESGLTSLAVKCSTQPIFYEMAKALYQVEINPQSASFMGLACFKQKKIKEAIPFYEQAISLENNPKEKAKTCFTLASLLGNNDQINARDYYQKALQWDPKMTKVYLAIAQLYINSKDCATTDFDKKAIVYLALQTANKQLVVDSKSNTSLDKFITKYTVDSLTLKDISKARLNGKNYTVTCWINETFQFPEK